jgi:hypothetical protein
MTMTKPRQRTEKMRAYSRAHALAWGKKYPDRKRENNRRWAKNHNEEITARRRAVAAAVVELKARPCADCGGTFPTVCMDFDHRPGEVKKFSLSQVATHSLKDALAEIAKCDLVCANCHRIRTHILRDHQALVRAPKAAAAELQLALDLGKKAA